MKVRINRKRWLLMWTIIALCLFAAAPELATAQEFCWKDSYGRGVGTIPGAGSYGKACTFITKVPCDSKKGGTDMGCFCLISKCPKGKEYDAGLCYEPCKAGYSGVGPVCWGRPPKVTTIKDGIKTNVEWVNCGMGAAINDKACGEVTADQVISVASLAWKLEEKATEGPKNAEELAGLKDKLKELIEAYERAKKPHDVANAVSAASELSEQEIVTPEDIARVSAQIAALVDPSGVADAVAAYTYPKCSSYFPSGADPEAAVQWVDSSYRPDKSQPENAFIGGYEGDRPQRICIGQQPGDKFPGTWHPGKISDGKCNFAYGAGRTVVDQYRTLVIKAPQDFIWVPSSYDSSGGGMRQPLGALIGGHQKDRPLRICRAQHENGQHPGKIYEGKCEIAYGSTRIQKTEYEVLIPIPKSLPDGFIKCADEGGTCRYNGRVAVFYGDGASKWKVAQKTSETVCNAKAIGGDPAPGAAKSCYIPANAKPMLPSNYIACAKAGEMCTFSGMADVYYGAGDGWVKKSTSGSISCASGSFFGRDPAPGADKACYVPSKAAPSLPSGYVVCAQEDQTCNFKGTVNVYFGAAGKWKVRTLESQAACTKDALGDPAPGVKKACYIPSSAALPGQ